MTLFQEDNILGMNACQSNIWSSISKVEMSLIIVIIEPAYQHVLFRVYTEHERSPYTEHAASGLPNPAHLEVVQAQDQQSVSCKSYVIYQKV